MRETAEPSGDPRGQESFLYSVASHLFDAIKVAPLDAITGRAVMHQPPNSLWRWVSLGNSNSVVHELKIRLPEGGQLDLIRLIFHEWCPTHGTALYEKRIPTPCATLLDQDGRVSCRFPTNLAAKLHEAALNRLAEIEKDTEQRLRLLIADVLRQPGSLEWQRLPIATGREGFSTTTEGVTLMLQRSENSIFGFSKATYEVRADLVSCFFEVSSSYRGERAWILFESVRAQHQENVTASQQTP